MEQELTVGEVVELVTKAWGCKLTGYQRKQILFRGTLPNGGIATLLTPYSKYHPKQGFFWIDISEQHTKLFNESESAAIVFRLEGRLMVMIKWSDLKPYLIEECKRFNNKEKNHWKLNIYTDHIKVSGNPNECKIEMNKY